MSLKSVLTGAFAYKAWLGRLNAAMGQSAIGEIAMAGASFPEANTTEVQPQSGTPTAAATQGNEPGELKNAA